MEVAAEFEQVQKKVADLIKDRVLIGHALHHDLRCLMLTHPKKDIRDTSRYSEFKALSKARAPSLKFLAEQLLGQQIQQQSHSSLEDAQIAMELYKKVKKQWESELFKKNRNFVNRKNKAVASTVTAAEQEEEYEDDEDDEEDD